MIPPHPQLVNLISESQNLKRAMWLGRFFPLLRRCSAARASPGWFIRLLHRPHNHPCDSIELIFSGRMLAPPNKLARVPLELKGL
jgi:hypothetical protein